MTRYFFKRLFLFSTGIILILGSILVIHIYLVTRRTPPDAATVAMARIDFRQDIGPKDAGQITTWLYQQKGVEHVLCNPDGELAVFTYHPLSVNADKIVSDFNKALPYHAVRFLPDETAMKSGCPVARTSVTYRLMNLFK